MKFTDDDIDDLNVSIQASEQAAGCSPVGEIVSLYLLREFLILRNQICKLKSKIQVDMIKRIDSTVESLWPSIEKQFIDFVLRDLRREQYREFINKKLKRRKSVDPKRDEEIYRLKERGLSWGRIKKIIDEKYAPKSNNGIPISTIRSIYDRMVKAKSAK